MSSNTNDDYVIITISEDDTDSDINIQSENIIEVVPDTIQDKKNECVISSKLKTQNLSAQSKELIANVQHFMNLEADLSDFMIPPRRLLERVVAATGVTVNTVNQIIKEAIDDNNLATSRYNENIKAVLDCTDKAKLRQIYLDCIINEHHIPTISGLCKKFKLLSNFTISTNVCRVAMRKMGFTLQGAKYNRKMLLEKHEFRLHRIQFLRKMLRYRSEERKIVYLAALEEFFLRDNNFVVLHAGDEQKFIQKAKLIFKINGKNSNLQEIPQHIKQNVIPNILPRSVIIMDNSRYYKKLSEKHPSSTSSTETMKNWLRIRNIPHNDNLQKNDLYNIIKKYRPNYKQYLIDKIFIENNFDVLRLPIGNPDLNPFENVWLELRKEITSRKTQKFEDLLRFCGEWFDDQSRQESWKIFCGQISETEERYVMNEQKFDEEIDKMLVHYEIDSFSDVESDSDFSGEEDFG